MKNGNNMAITDFQGTNCPMLNYVCVDDVTYAQDNFTNIDTHVIFAENCELSTDDFDVSSSVNLYPNPAKDVLNIDKKGIAPINSIHIYDVLGRLVMTLNEVNDHINVTHLDSGLLFVRIETVEGVVTKKIVKE